MTSARTPWMAVAVRVLPARISSRLSLLIGLAILSMLLLLGWMYHQRYASQRSQALQSEVEVAQGVATTFAAYIRDIHRQSITLGSAVLALSHHAGAADRLLASTVSHYEGISNISWTSPSGRVLASSEPKAIRGYFGDRPYFHEVAGGRDWAISALLPQGRITGRPVFIVATGIRDKRGQLLGVMIFGIEPTRLGDVLLTQRRTEGRSYSLFDGNGILVYRNPEVDLTWELRTSWHDADPVMVRALRGNPETGEIVSILTGQHHLAARVPISELGWIAGASRPVETALAPIRRALTMDILLTCLFTAIALGLAAFIGRSIAVPLHRLQEDVQTFASGDLSHRADVSGPEEVVLVADGFNRMAGEIQAFQETLDARVRQRTGELETSNRELESFSHTVAHDLRSPLRALDGFSRYLLRHYAERLDDRGKDYLNRIHAAAQRMGRLIDDLLGMARISRTAMTVEKVDLGAMADDIIGDLRKIDPQRRVVVEIDPGMKAHGDPELLSLALSHLLENAFKFTKIRDDARIRVGVMRVKDQTAYFVQDNGMGFDMAYADKLFLPFHRLQQDDAVPGTGIGLAMVQRIIARHGGRVWAESEEGKGATFWFTLGESR